MATNLKLFVIFFVLIIAGCGGSGSESNPPSEDPGDSTVVIDDNARQPPAGTLWFRGVTSESLEYSDWRAALDPDPTQLPGQNYSLYLPQDELYFDVLFQSWTARQGGGFSYTRTPVDANGNTIGEAVFFAKADNADWTLEQNQDHLSSNVAITRADEKGIFNILAEDCYSPTGSCAK